MQCLLALPGFASLVHHEQCTAQCQQPCLMSALHVSATTSHAQSPVPPTVCCWEPVLESWGITFHEQQDAIEVLQEIAKRLPHDLWKCFDVMCVTHQQRTFGCQCHASAITSYVVSTFQIEVYAPEIDATLQNLLLETTTWDEKMESHCEACHEAVELQQRHEYSPSAKFTIITLLRYARTPNSRTGPKRLRNPKRQTVVHPSDILDIGGAVWNLVSVVVHHGQRRNTSHYTTCVRTRNQWVHFDDAVRGNHDDLPTVANNNGVMFAYERVTDDAAAPHPQATSSTTPPQTSSMHLTTSDTSMAKPKQASRADNAEQHAFAAAITELSQAAEETQPECAIIERTSGVSDASPMDLIDSESSTAGMDIIHSDTDDSDMDNSHANMDIIVSDVDDSDIDLAHAVLPAADVSPPLPPPHLPPTSQMDTAARNTVLSELANAAAITTGEDSDEDLMHIAFPPDTHVPLIPQAGLTHHSPVTHNAVASAKASGDTTGTPIAESRCMDHTCSDEVAQGHVDKLLEEFNSDNGDCIALLATLPSYMEAGPLAALDAELDTAISMLRMDRVTSAAALQVHPFMAHTMSYPLYILLRATAEAQAVPPTFYIDAFHCLMHSAFNRHFFVKMGRYASKSMAWTCQVGDVGDGKSRGLKSLMDSIVEVFCENLAFAVGDPEERFQFQQSGSTAGAIENLQKVPGT